MTKRMLIDSTHAEETRVVVLDGNRLEEFDLETTTKHQLKGNIYLAKIVRVEPSLQAAFVEYGGNRHGFLAFGEIHPDYYQIPIADRKRLLEAQEQEAREEEEQADREAQDQPDDQPDDDIDDAAHGFGPHDPGHQPVAGTDDMDDLPDPSRVTQAASIAADIMVAPDQAAALFPADAADGFDLAGADMAPEASDDVIGEPADDPIREAALDPAEPSTASDVTHGHAEEALAPESAAEEPAPAPEQIGGENDTDDQSARRASSRFLRHYKIQEVIRRRQILLIQVVKEERGSKGAALTTYISLAGRFSVLMPNSPRGGGISRKITSASDRRRLKEVTAELDLPRGMGLIVRTAGANRPKPEILRDCEYLLNQWDQIRDLTMKSMAPALIYEEASLIKRAIRDVYSRDVDEILVDGEQGWRAARDFMRMLMPTHARKVQLWKDPQPLFAKAQVELQLEAMLTPTVQLKSGGYLVINQTEALVAIDVNSGRSTRERGIEETALRTNLEAAEEAARQLRLRDLAGLIVIDFIDMESRRNVAAVERKLKDALKQDRARIQVGGISHFGLLEMSRQRLRPSLTETNFVMCPDCGGAGHVRSTESAALFALRAIEEEGGKRRAAEIVVYCPSSLALYILNHKRQRLTEVEIRHAMLVNFAADETLLPPALRIERIRAQLPSDAPAPVQQLPPPEPFEDPDEIEAEEPDEETVAETAPADETTEEREQRRRRRRRRRGRSRDDAARPAGDEPARAGDDDEAGTAAVAAPTSPDLETDRETDLETRAPTEQDAAGPTPSGTEAAAEPGSADAEEGERRRRGRRGGRRRRRDAADDAAGPAADPAGDDAVPTPAYENTLVPSYAPSYPPVYAGPTPADPFAGASAFDIFDSIEQAEEARAAAVAEAAAARPRPQPAPEPEPIVRSAAELIEHSSQPEPTPEPEPTPDQVPLASTLADIPAEPPAAEPAAAAEPEPEPEPPVSAPLIQPVLVSAEPPPSERKRGWWRR